MAGLRIKKGDKVVVLAGKDKGKEGTVSRVLPSQSKVVVEGVNTAKRHRAARSATESGGIKDVDMPIHVSNVALVGADGKPTRVGYSDKDGKKIRIDKRSEKEV